MASHQLIENYLAELCGRLPADAVDELADGLDETWRRHLGDGLAPADAARAAIAEFGTPNQVTAAFVRLSPGRRIAMLLLGSGPLVGACWGASLVTAHAWTWPVPIAGVTLYALALLAVVGTLVAAATSRHGYRRTRLAAAGGLGLVALDAIMIAAVLTSAPVPMWPMAAAILASLARIAATLRALPSTVAS